MELNPQADFDDGAGISLHQANIANGKLTFPGNDLSFQKGSWTSPETLVHEHLYHYDVVISRQTSENGVRLIVGGTAMPLFGTGHFEGNICSAASDQIIALLEVDTWGAADIESASITS